MLDTILKVLGTIALVIIAIVLLPFLITAIVWLIELIAGFSIGGFLLVLLIALVIYIIWG